MNPAPGALNGRGAFCAFWFTARREQSSARLVSLDVCRQKTILTIRAAISMYNSTSSGVPVGEDSPKKKGVNVVVMF